MTNTCRVTCRMTDWILVRQPLGYCYHKYRTKAIQCFLFFSFNNSYDTVSILQNVDNPLAPLLGRDMGCRYF